MFSFSTLKHQCKVHWKKWTILCIWIIGIAAMVGLTIIDLCPIIENFYDEHANMAVQISVIRNQTIPPKLYICAPYKPVYLLNLTESLSNIRLNLSTENECQICKEMKKMGWDLWRFMDAKATDEDFQEQLAGRIVTKLVQNMTNDPLSEKKSNWNFIILDAIWTVFTRVQDTDDLISKFQLPNFDWNKLVYIPYVPPLENEHFEYLLEKFMLKVCSHIEWGNGGDYVEQADCARLLISQPIIFRPDQLCFAPELDNITNEIELGIDLDFANTDIWNSLGTGKSYDLTLEIPFVGDIIKPLFQSDNGKEKATSVKMEYTVQLNVKDERVEKPCFKDYSYNDCILRCQTEKMTDSCQCIPFTTRNLLNSTKTSANMSYCHLGTYKNCKPSFSGCHQECQTACMHTSYSWIASSRYDTDQNWEFSVKMTPNVAPYIEFTVNVKDTLVNLLSQIGGSLGFYLGWSGLSMFGLLIFCIEWYTQWATERLEKLKAKNDPKTLHLWWWQWLAKKPQSDPQSRIYKQEDIEKIVQEKFDLIKGKLEKEIEDLKEKLGSLKNGV